MGAGFVECDVKFTKDKELLCRGARNDLHTPSDILLSPLAAKRTRPVLPATLDASGKAITPAGAECRTSDITLAEFRTQRGRMDASDPQARTPRQDVGGTANWRTDLYSGPTSGTLLTHKEAVALFQQLGGLPPAGPRDRGWADGYRPLVSWHRIVPGRPAPPTPIAMVPL